MTTKKVIYFLGGVVPTQDEVSEISAIESGKFEVFVRNGAYPHMEENCDFVAGSFPSAYRDKAIFEKAFPQEDMSPSFLRQRCETVTTITNFQSGNGFVFGTGVQNGNADYTDDYAIGTQCCYFETKGAGAQAACRKYGFTQMSIVGKLIRLQLKIDNIKNLNEITFFAGNSTVANAFKWTFQTTGTNNTLFVQSGEWVTITLSLADYTSTTGTPDAENITDFVLALYDKNNGGIVTCKWQSLELVDVAEDLFPNGVISITFDDSEETVYTKAYPKMKALGLRGVTYNIKEYIGTVNRMSLVNLKEMYADGWDVSSHAYATANHNSRFSNLDLLTTKTDFKNLKSWHALNGFNRGGGFAYPGGAFNRFTLETVRDHFSYGRTIISKSRETLPPADRYKLRAMSSISSYSGGYTASSFTTANTGHIAKCKANKSWLIMVFHKIVDGSPASTTECSKTDFDAIMDSIVAQGVPVMTIREVLDRLGE
jgi:peptidoglycan/xylan/chitin deacetylase (PgdA/CDA1 family)